MDISKNIIERLVRLKNEDETEWLRTLKTFLDYYFNAVSLEHRDLIRAETDRLAKEIGRRSEAEKREGV